MLFKIQYNDENVILYTYIGTKTSCNKYYILICKRIIANDTSCECRKITTLCTYVSKIKFHNYNTILSL